MPKIALSKLVEETGFLKGVDCFVGSKKTLSVKEISVLEKNIDLLKDCLIWQQFRGQYFVKGFLSLQTQ